MGSSDAGYARRLQASDRCDLSDTAMRVGRNWDILPADAASRSTTRMKLAWLCVALGDSERESPILHSHKNFPPTSVNQMRLGQREPNIIGHCPSTSRMSERHDRGVCPNELLVRNTIMTNINGGWGTAPDFHLPRTVTGHVRTG